MRFVQNYIGRYVETLVAHVIPGSDRSRALKHRLISSVQQNRVPHAQLFLGPEGCGNLPMAICLRPGFLNCEVSGQYRFLRAMSVLSESIEKISIRIYSHIPFHLPYLQVRKESKKCADWLRSGVHFCNSNPMAITITGSTLSRRKQGEISMPKNAVSFTACHSKPLNRPGKVLVLWLPEFLEKEGNRLLKLIEEPPEQTIFLFVGHNPDRIINTILKPFCRSKPFGRLQEDEVAWYLQEEQGACPKCPPGSCLSNGNIARAAELVQVSQESYTSTLRQWMLACHAYDITDCLPGMSSSFIGGVNNKNNSFYPFREVCQCNTDCSFLTSLRR